MAPAWRGSYRGGMETPRTAALTVGDLVRYRGTSSELVGLVVELLPDHSVRVCWSDPPALTVHRPHHLEVVALGFDTRAERRA